MTLIVHEDGRRGGGLKLSDEGKEHLARIDRAYKRMETLVARKYQPLLRVVTGKRTLKVRIHPSVSSTDGRTIVYLRLPLELGDADVDNHDKAVCGLRDESGTMRCRACAILEEIDLTIFHESFHMVFESFADVGEKTKKELWLRMAEERALPEELLVPEASAMDVAHAINKWLPLFVNVIEDVYVNEAGWQARKGLRVAGEAMYRRMMTEKMLGIDGTSVGFEDWPVTFRVAVIFLALGQGCGDDLARHVAGEEAEFLVDDPEVKNIVSRIHKATHAGDRFRLAVEALECVRKHGFCFDEKHDEPEPEEPEPEPEGEPTGQGEPCEDGEPGSTSEPTDERSKSDDPGEAKTDDSEEDSVESDEGDESDSDGDGEGDAEADSDDAHSDDEGDLDSDEDFDGDEGEGESDDDEDGDDDGPGKGERDDDFDSDDEYDDFEDDEDFGKGPSDEDGPDDEDFDGDDEEDADGYDDEGDGDDSSDGDDDDDFGGDLGDDFDGADDDTFDGEPDAGETEGEADGESGETSKANADEDDGHSSDKSTGLDSDTGSSGTDSIPDSDEDVTVNDSIDTGKPEASEDAAPWSPDKGMEDDEEEVDRLIEDFMGHGEFKKDDETPEEREEREVTEVALSQRGMFDEPTFNLREGVKWKKSPDRTGYKFPVELPPGVLSGPLARMRVVMTENRKIGIERSLKRGPRLDTAHLSRLYTEDDRLHARRSVPKKRDWAVVVGLDLSGSTGSCIHTIRAGGVAVSQMLSALGVDFCVYGHSGDYDAVTMQLGKDFNEPWNATARARVEAFVPFRANYDGHSLEVYRRLVEARRATDKLILYFTDGAMPCENYDEELRILQKNIAICRQRKINLVGVGVRNTEPRDHGLDTIRFDGLTGQFGLDNLVVELGKRLQVR